MEEFKLTDKEITMRDLSLKAGELRMLIDIANGTIRESLRLLEHVGNETSQLESEIVFRLNRKDSNE